MSHLKDHNQILYELKEEIDSAADYDLLKSELIYYELEKEPREEAGEMDIVGVNLYSEEDDIYKIMDIFEIKSSDSIQCQTHAREQLHRARKYFTEIYDEDMFDEVNTFVKICDQEVHSLESDIDVPPQYLDDYRAIKSDLDKMTIINHGDNENEKS